MLYPYVWYGKFRVNLFMECERYIIGGTRFHFPVTLSIPIPRCDALHSLQSLTADVTRTVIPIAARVLLSSAKRFVDIPRLFLDSFLFPTYAKCRYTVRVFSHRQSDAVFGIYERTLVISTPHRCARRK